MPPEGYTTVTITEGTAAKVAELTALIDELGIMDDAIEHAVDLARTDQRTVTNADLARLLYEGLADE